LFANDDVIEEWERLESWTTSTWSTTQSISSVDVFAVVWLRKVVF